MRTLLAALALALAVPATATRADACGGYDVAIAAPLHIASGEIGQVWRNEAGILEVFISYPDIDGERGRLYGIFAELHDDVMTRALVRDQRRWSRHGAAMIEVVVQRNGDTGAWFLVSYTHGPRT